MSYIRAVYLDLTLCCEDFIKGTELLEQCLHNDAIISFERAYKSAPDSYSLFTKYCSYYGFSCLLCGKRDAISLCRSTAKAYPYDGDICMNLARAEIFLENRSKALDIIDTGLQLSREHTGLQKLRAQLGVRKRKLLPFLSRNNTLSHAVGKLLRKS